MAQSIKTLNYIRKGTGQKEVLVFLHGFCEDASMWKEVIATHFEDYTIITIDLPGFGQSPPQAQGSIQKMAEAVLELLQDLKIDRFNLFGHSMGGYVALAIAEQAAEKLTGFGLIHSHPFADDESAKINRQKSIDFIKSHGSSLYVKQLIPNLFPASFVTSNRFLIEQLTFKANRFPDQGICNALTAMINRSDQRRTLQHLGIPVLFLIGDLDTLLPVDQLIEQSKFPAIAQIEVLKNVGHMGPFENPKAVKRSILNYLAFLKELT